MTASTISILLGGSLFGPATDSSAKFHTPEVVQECLSVFRKYGHTGIDTSRGYSPEAPGASEGLIGLTDAATWATIDTKVLSKPGNHSSEKIAQCIDDSLHSLHIPKIHIEYLHYPDRTQKLEDVVRAMYDGIEAGKMEHWGISNYSINEIKQIIAICNDKNYPKPVVYQGHYNAITRKAEDELLPLLRQHNIAFYAYSPAAGGALSATSSRMSATGHIGNWTRATYGASELQPGITKVQTAAAAAELSGHEVALRWTQHHSALSAAHGDAIIIGASSATQLESTLRACAAGPLPEDLARLVNEVWDDENVRAKAPNYSPLA